MPKKASTRSPLPQTLNPEHAAEGDGRGLGMIVWNPGTPRLVGIVLAVREGEKHQTHEALYKPFTPIAFS